jgi:hypothetical protein
MDTSILSKGLTFTVSEESISQATRLRLEGERWSKNLKLLDDSWTQFVSIPLHMPDVWKKGVRRDALISPWKDVALIIQKFITCEGQFSIFFHYHI